MQATIDIDRAAALVEFGRRATGTIDDSLAATLLAGQLTAALRNLYQARYLMEDSWGSFVAYFLTPPSPSSQGTAPQRSTWMQEGIAAAMQNGNRLRTSIQSLKLTPQDQASFEHEIRGLLVSSSICTGFLPSDDLGIFNRLREMGVTFQDLKWCWELQEALRCMGIYHAASLRLYEGVVWTCFYITDAGKDTTEEVSLARDLLALAWHTYGSSDQDRRSVLFAVKVKKELEESAERCSGPSDGKSCSDDDREHFSACSLVRSSGRIQSTGITNLFEEGMKVGSQDAAGGGQGMDESS